MKVVDPVCKMTIDSEKAAATSQHQGQTIYFCAKGCKAKFDQESGEVPWQITAALRSAAGPLPGVAIK